MIETWGYAPDGSPVLRLTFKRDGLSLRVISFGAAIQDLRLDEHDYALVAGYCELEPYFTNPYCFGATVGRYANRIANSQTIIDGQTVTLNQNFLGKHHLHGGRNGLSWRNWRLEDYGDDFAVFSDQLPDGHMGFPGKLTITVTYRMYDESLLHFDVKAHSDAPTLCNITNHSYFNLDGSDTIKHHHLQVNADSYVPIDNEGIPIGNPMGVEQSDLDFRKRRPLYANGNFQKLDHNFCLSQNRQPLKHAARLISDLSGLCLDVSTTEPGLQAYTASGIKADKTANLHNHPKRPYMAIALEPQIWPDAPNQSGFPSALIMPDETYAHTTIFQMTQSYDTIKCNTP